MNDFPIFAGLSILAFCIYQGLCVVASAIRNQHVHVGDVNLRVVKEDEDGTSS